jgi:hypothetical protein
MTYEKIENDINNMTDICKEFESYDAVIYDKSDIFPLDVSWGRDITAVQYGQPEYVCSIAPKFDPHWDQCVPDVIDKLLYNLLDAMCENAYEITDINKFMEFKKINDDNGNLYFKFSNVL